jgi:hypothetical protein
VYISSQKESSLLRPVRLGDMLLEGGEDRVIKYYRRNCKCYLTHSSGMHRINNAGQEVFPLFNSSTAL